MQKAVGKLIICEKCGRKILIERALNGSNHTMSMWGYCWDCMPPDEQKKAIEFHEFDEDDLEPEKKLSERDEE